MLVNLLCFLNSIRQNIIQNCYITYNVPDFISKPIRMDKQEVEKGLMSKERIKIKYQ